MPEAMEDSWIKVTENDGGFSLHIDQILSPPIKGQPTVLRSTRRLLAGPESSPARTTL